MTITNADITSLRHGASIAGDFVQVAICDVALGESRDLDRAVEQGLLSEADVARVREYDAASARAECARVIDHAAAQ